jgi:hypothetical protein
MVVCDTEGPGKRVRRELRSSATILTENVAEEDGERELIRDASHRW